MTTNWNRDLKSSTWDGVGLSKTVDIDSGLISYRRPTWKWDVPYEQWRDEALCNGMDVRLFELSEEVDEDTQHELIAEGLKVCSSCPVRAACMSNSSPADRYWTSRGGQPPEGLFPDTVPVVEKSAMQVWSRSNKRPGVKLGKTCDNGHDDWLTNNSTGRKFCAPCRRERNRKAKRKSRLVD